MTVDMDDMKLIITGGGTGGHIFPGLAVAKELLDKKKGHDILWVGARRGMESQMVPGQGIEYIPLSVTGLKGKGMLYKIASLANLARAFVQSLGIIRRYQPDVVLGVGGYASGPMGLAAIFTGKPLALAEQNAVPGLTNKWLGKWAKAVFVSWPGMERHFPQGKVELTGNPVRREFALIKDRADDGKLNILIAGGSQGASAVNSAVMEASRLMAHLAGRVAIIHQTGRADLEKVAAAAKASSLDWKPEAFLENMGEKLEWADLVISRAGAGAVSEICAAGRAAVYIPYPRAAGDHQAANAGPSVSEGAAILIREAVLTPESLAGVILDLERDRRKVKEMGAKARNLGRPHAASMMAGLLAELAGEAV